MKTIRILATLSIDGFYMPFELQQQYNFEPYEYQSFHYGTDSILINTREYKELEIKGTDIERKTCIIQKNISLLYHTTKDKNIFQAIKQLKKEEKGILLLVGNNRTLINKLLNENLVDEISIYLFPILLGKGKRMFPVLSEQLKWKVKNRQIYDSGITMIHCSR